jgi:hypothetical protein
MSFNLGHALGSIAGVALAPIKVATQLAVGAAGVVGGAIGLGGLLGGGAGGALPQMSQQSSTPQNQDFGPQTNLENLMQQTGLQQPQISQTSRVGGGGLI